MANQSFTISPFKFSCAIELLNPSWGQVLTVGGLLEISLVSHWYYNLFSSILFLSLFDEIELILINTYSYIKLQTVFSNYSGSIFISKFNIPSFIDAGWYLIFKL